MSPKRSPATAEPPSTGPEAKPQGVWPLVRRVLREPLTLFLLLGAAIFAGILGVRAMQRPVVTIDAQELNQLASYWEVQMQRPPNKAELKAIIRDRINEELLAREAIRLGLDRNDMIVRRRLAQKMTFATDDVAPIAEPDDATLKAYYAKTSDHYAAPARVAFQQVFFSGDRPHGGAEKAAAQALSRAEEDQRDPSGDPFLFPLAYDDVSLDELVRDYGPAFVKTLETAPIGAWTGPVLSPYGWHIVKVSQRRSSQAASFESVKPQVRDAYMAEKREANNASFLAKLHQRYRVVVAGVPDN